MLAKLPLLLFLHDPVLLYPIPWIAVSIYECMRLHTV